MTITGIMGVLLLAVIVGIVVWIIIGSRKRKWYRVCLANNDVQLLYRDLNERWWRTSDRYMRFKDERGKEVTFPSEAHWVLFWKEVPDNELDIVREEIVRMREAKNKED